MTIPATPVADSGPRYGGFWIRVLAHLIDGLILSILYVPAAFVLGVPLEPAYDARWLREELTYVIVAWLYFAVMESSAYQATLGKRVLRLMVTDLGGGRIGFWRATGRYLAKFVSAIILFIGYMMVGWTERKQGLHDKMAGTLVVRGRPDPAAQGAPTPADGSRTDAASVVRRG